MLLSQALSEYEDFFIIEKGLSTNTHQAYLNDLKLFIAYLKSKNIIATEEIDFPHIHDFLFVRSSSVVLNTLNREKSSIKNFLQYCLAINEIEKDFSDTLKVEKKNDFFPSILTKTEIKKLLEYTHNEKLRLEKKEKKTISKFLLAVRNDLILKLLYALGLRVSELTNIRLDDISLDGWCRIHGKGDKIRNVPLLPDLIYDIKHYQDQTRKKLLSSIKKNKMIKGHQYLLINQSGKPLSRVAIWKWVKTITTACKIDKNIYPHTFRHTCATHMLQGGADLRVIQELVGHSSIQTTELYTHLQTDDIRKTFSKYHPLYH